MKRIYEVTVSQYMVDEKGLAKGDTTVMSAGLYFRRDDACHMMVKTARTMAKNWHVPTSELDQGTNGHITFDGVNGKGVKYHFHVAVKPREVYDSADEASHKK